MPILRDVYITAQNSVHDAKGQKRKSKHYPTPKITKLHHISSYYSKIVQREGGLRSDLSLNLSLW